LQGQSALSDHERTPEIAHEKQFYIDGAWVDPIKPNLIDVIDPSTEEAYTQISAGSAADVDRGGAHGVHRLRPLDAQAAPRLVARHPVRIQEASERCRRCHLARDGRPAPVRP
jgi:acyl-CoA reductase-like NAD-dependent aldehyde dehydrogenase